MFSLQQRLAQQGMTLSDPEPILSGPRAAWHSPSLDVGPRLSAEESGDDPRTNPAPQAMGAAAPTAPTCLRSGGASHPPSAPRSASPQPLDLFGQVGVLSSEALGFLLAKPRGLAHLVPIGTTLWLSTPLADPE